MYCLQVAAYHLFFNASRVCYLLALIIFVFLRFFDIFRKGSRTVSFLDKEEQGDMNLTFSGVLLDSVIKDIITNNVF
ncbi:unnamed protein product [Cochlearia groenlandica]